MAEEAGIYKHLWRPEEVNVKYAVDLIKPLEDAYMLLESEPERFKKHNPSNGWGHFYAFKDFIEKLIKACKEDPDAEIEVSR